MDANSLNILNEQARIEYEKIKEFISQFKVKKGSLSELKIQPVEWNKSIVFFTLEHLDSDGNVLEYITETDFDNFKDYFLKFIKREGVRI